MHNSQCIIVPTQSYLFLYSFWGSLLYLLIILSYFCLFIINIYYSLMSWLYLLLLLLMLLFIVHRFIFSYQIFDGYKYKLSESKSLQICSNFLNFLFQLVVLQWVGWSIIFLKFLIHSVSILVILLQLQIYSSGNNSCFFVLQLS